MVTPYDHYFLFTTWKLATEAYAIRLPDALNYTGTPAIRTHDGTHLL